MSECTEAQTDGHLFRWQAGLVLVLGGDMEGGRRLAERSPRGPSRGSVREGAPGGSGLKPAPGEGVREDGSFGRKLAERTSREGGTEAAGSGQGSRQRLQVQEGEWRPRRVMGGTQGASQGWVRRATAWGPCCLNIRPCTSLPFACVLFFKARCHVGSGMVGRFCLYIVFTLKSEKKFGGNRCGHLGIERKRVLRQARQAAIGRGGDPARSRARQAGEEGDPQDGWRRVGSVLWLWGLWSPCGGMNTNQI